MKSSAVGITSSEYDFEEEEEEGGAGGLLERDLGLAMEPVTHPGLAGHGGQAVGQGHGRAGVEDVKPGHWMMDSAEGEPLDRGVEREQDQDENDAPGREGDDGDPGPGQLDFGEWNPGEDPDEQSRQHQPGRGPAEPVPLVGRRLGPGYSGA